MARKKRAITVPLETIWEIPDAAWERLQPILAATYPAKPTGRGRIDFRKAIDAAYSTPPGERRRSAAQGPTPSRPTLGRRTYPGLAPKVSWDPDSIRQKSAELFGINPIGMCPALVPTIRSIMCFEIFP